MPFKSKAQQRFMFAKRPKMAKEWADKTDFSKLPEKVGKGMAKCAKCGKSPCACKGVGKGQARPGPNGARCAECGKGVGKGQGSCGGHKKVGKGQSAGGWVQPDQTGAANDGGGRVNMLPARDDYARLSPDHPQGGIGVRSTDSGQQAPTPRTNRFGAGQARRVGRGQAMPPSGPPPGMMPGMGMPPMPPMMPSAQSGMPEPLKPKKSVKKPRKSKAKPTPGTSGPRKKPAIQKRFSPRGGLG